MSQKTFSIIAGLKIGERSTLGQYKDTKITESVVRRWLLSRVRDCPFGEFRIADVIENIPKRSI